MTSIQLGNARDEALKMAQHTGIRQFVYWCEHFFEVDDVRREGQEVQLEVYPGGRQIAWGKMAIEIVLRGRAKMKADYRQSVTGSGVDQDIPDHLSEARATSNA